MKAKRKIALTLGLVLALSLPLGVFAESQADARRTFSGDDYTFTIPELLTHDMAGVEANDSLWALVGVTDGQDQVEENEEHGVVADLYSSTGEMNVKVMSRQNDATMDIFDLKQMSEEEKEEFLEQLLVVNTDEITLDRKYLDINGQPFYYLRTDGTLGDYGEAHEITCGTIFNGHTLNFNIHSAGAGFSPALEETFDALVHSVQITKTLTPEEAAALNAPEPMELRDYIPILIVCGFLVLVVLAPLVYIPVHRKLEKKRKAVMGKRLSEFERIHREQDWDPGELRFANATDCTREAIHSFSLYHAYIKQMASVILGVAICAAVLVVVFVFQMEWWYKLIALGVTVYFGYRVVNMPRMVEKVQRKVMGQEMSLTAQYAFYEKAFRVSGNQPAILYPYFRITSVRTFGHYAYLYYGADNAYLVDRYGMSVGEWEAFLRFIREKTGKNAE